MTNSQGTSWETSIVNRAKAQGLTGMRLVKRSEKDEADVYLASGDFIKADLTVPAVLWKRIVKTKGKANRQPLGERYVAVLTVDDFLDLVRKAEGTEVYVQAKWTQNLSVTKVLAGLRAWLDQRGKQES